MTQATLRRESLSSRMFALHRRVMNGLNLPYRMRGISDHLVKITIFIKLLRYLRQSKVRRRSRHRRYSPLRLCWLVFGVLYVLYSLFTYLPASASTSIDAVPLNGDNSVVFAGSKFDNGTGIIVHARGKKAMFQVRPTLRAGDILGVSIVQSGAHIDNQFGIETLGYGRYPYTSFIKREGGNFYFKCLNSYCWTGSIASLGNDANYLVYAHVVRNSSDFESDFEKLQGYLNNFQTYMSTITNHLVNINGSIYNLDQHTKEYFNGVYEWFRSQNVGFETRHNSLMRKIDEFLDSPANKKAEKELQQAQQLESQNNSGSDLQSSLSDDSFNQKSESLLTTIKNIAMAPPMDCKISVAGKIPLDMDFCADSRPAFLSPLITIPVGIASILLSIFVVKSIIREIHKFKDGV